MRRIQKILTTLTNILFKDLRWKLLSLGLGFIVWFVGMNMDNPVETRTFERLLTLSNMEALKRDNMVVLNDSLLRNTKIDINVRATKTDLNALDTKNSNIVASVDLRTIDASQVLQSDHPVKMTLDVDVFILPGYERLNRWPYSVTVEVDKYELQTKSVLVYAVGEPKTGYELMRAVGAHETVLVSGAKSIVDQVKTVRVQVNVQDADEDISRVEKLVAYDENDVDITSMVELSVSQTHVDVSVLPYKTVPLKMLVSGNLAPNYTLTDVTTSPSNVAIVGEAEALKKIDTLTLGTINLDNVSETFEKSYDIRSALPAGISLRSGAPAEAVVTVTVEKQDEQSFTLPKDAISVTGAPGKYFRYEDNEPIRMAVRGAEEAIRSLTADQIEIHLNLANLSDGKHTVPLMVTLPSRAYTLSGNIPTVDVIIFTVEDSDSSGEDNNGDDTTEDNPVMEDNDEDEDSE